MIGFSTRAWVLIVAPFAMASSATSVQSLSANSIWPSQYKNPPFRPSWSIFGKRSKTFFFDKKLSFHSQRFANSLNGGEKSQIGVVNFKIFDFFVKTIGAKG